MPGDLAVVGLGQSERGDDGAGPAVIERLRVLAGPNLAALPGLKTWILRDDLTDLLEILGAYSQVLVIDSVWTQRAPPGTIWSWPLDALPEAVVGSLASTHTLSLSATLELARALGLLTPRWPEEGDQCVGSGFFWGIEITGPPEIGGPMSEPVLRAVETVVQRLNVTPVILGENPER